MKVGGQGKKAEKEYGKASSACRSVLRRWSAAPALLQ